jgi:hypothetical protein
MEAHMFRTGPESKDLGLGLGLSIFLGISERGLLFFYIGTAHTFDGSAGNEFTISIFAVFSSSSSSSSSSSLCRFGGYSVRFYGGSAIYERIAQIEN